MLNDFQVNACEIGETSRVGRWLIDPDASVRAAGLTATLAAPLVRSNDRRFAGLLDHRRVDGHSSSQLLGDHPASHRSRSDADQADAAAVPPRRVGSPRRSKSAAVARTPASVLAIAAGRRPAGGAVDQPAGPEPRRGRHRADRDGHRRGRFGLESPARRLFNAVPFCLIDPAMGIRFACHACGKRLNIKSELAGRRGVCPACSQTISHPPPATPRPPNRSIANHPGGRPRDQPAAVAAMTANRGSGATPKATSSTGGFGWGDV